MARQVKLAGKFATADDTARALGVPSSRLHKLKALAREVVSKRTEKTAPNGAKPADSATSAKVAVKSRIRKSSRNAPTKSRATARS
jgi:hypothetical protein